MILNSTAPLSPRTAPKIRSGPQAPGRVGLRYWRFPTLCTPLFVVFSLWLCFWVGSLLKVVYLGTPGGIGGGCFFGIKFRCFFQPHFPSIFSSFWLPFEIDFLTLLSILACIFGASNLHRFGIDFGSNSDTPDHVKKRF